MLVFPIILSPSQYLLILTLIMSAETLVYSDGLSLHYPPISDLFDNKENFFCKWFNFDIIEK